MDRWPGETVVTSGVSEPTSPASIQRATSEVRPLVAGLPEGFTFHDLTRFNALVLIGAGLDVKTA